MRFGTPAAALACTVPLALAAGCSVIAPLLPAPEPAAPPPAVVSKDGLAPITGEQVERIREAIGTKAPSPAVTKVWLWSGMRSYHLIDSSNEVK